MISSISLPANTAAAASTAAAVGKPANNTMSALPLTGGRSSTAVAPNAHSRPLASSVSSAATTSWSTTSTAPACRET